MAWADITNPAIDDKWGFQSHNILKDNAAYIHDTVLGDPDSNSDAVTIANGKAYVNHTDGLTIASGSKLTLSGEIVGSLHRFSVGLVAITLTSTDYYLGLGGGSTSDIFPIELPEAGSLVGYTYRIGVTTHLGNLTVVPRLRKNGATWVSFTGSTLTTTTVYGETVTAARGVNTFSASDSLGFILDITSAGNVTINAAMSADLVYDA